jgi:hypothetical protein
MNLVVLLFLSQRDKLRCGDIGKRKGRIIETSVDSKFNSIMSILYTGPINTRDCVGRMKCDLNVQSLKRPISNKTY